MTKVPPTGQRWSRAELPIVLREQLASLAADYGAMRYEESGEGQARTLTFADGTIWFPEGLQKDNPKVFVALALGIAALALIVLSFGALADGSVHRYWLPVATVLAMLAARHFWRASQARQSQAVADVAMGTLAMPDCLLLVAHGDAYFIPKSRILEFVVVTEHGSDSTSHRLHASYQDDLGETQRLFIGFLYGSDQQRQEVEQAHAKLNEWLAGD